MESSKILIAFDVDGTLNMTETYALYAYKKALSDFGNDKFSDEQILLRIGATFIDDIQYFFGKCNDEFINEFQEVINKYWYDGMRNKAKTYPYVKEMLGQLKRQGYILAICSNASYDELNIILNSLNIAEYFEYIQGITYKNNKSHSLKKLLERSNPDYAVMVGDREYDKKAAKDNDVAFIGCRYGYCKPDEFTDNDIQVFSVREIPECVNKLYS